MDKRIALQSNPRLTGRALVGDLSGLWRYRVGDHRIICEIKDKDIIILVIEIGDRKDVYR
jgi:mRNA interferase RelE/StbE